LKEKGAAVAGGEKYNCTPGLVSWERSKKNSNSSHRLTSGEWSGEIGVAGAGGKKKRHHTEEFWMNDRRGGQDHSCIFLLGSRDQKEGSKKYPKPNGSKKTGRRSPIFCASGIPE